MHEQIVRMLERECWMARGGCRKQLRQPLSIVVRVVTIDDGASELTMHPATNPGRRCPRREQRGSGDPVELLGLCTPIRPAWDTRWGDQMHLNCPVRQIPGDLNRIRGTAEARRLEINESRERNHMPLLCPGEESQVRRLKRLHLCGLT